MDIRDALTDTYLAQFYDAGALTRARDCLTSVRDIEIAHETSTSLTATAQVWGTAPSAYDVQFHAEVNEASDWVFSACSCPVARSTFAGMALGLEISHSLPSRWSRGTPGNFAMRPMRPAVRGGWVRSGAEWADLSGPVARSRFVPAQAEALQALHIDVEPRHRKIYDTHLAKERQRILGLVEDFDHNRVAIFSALTKLRQLALDPALVDPQHDRVGSAKINLLVDQLAEVTAEGHQVLVFSTFTSFLGRVRDRLTAEGIATVYLDGGTRDRRAVIEAFRRGEAPVFLISLKAGGVGLTLTEADYVYVLDPWWNPAAEAQAVDRAHRIGQDKHVNVYRLVATDTIEEKVMALKARKAELFAKVVDGGGATATGITADDIRDLFT